MQWVTQSPWKQGTVLIFFIIFFFALDTQAGHAQSWTWQNPLPQGNTLNSVAGDGTTLVAVGENATILRSTDDGLTWNSRPASHLFTRSSGNNLSAVASDGGTFVAVGPSGRIIRSLDRGDTWEVATLTFGGAFWGVAGNDTTFVAVGNRLLLVSTDAGEHWHRINYDSNNTLYDVAWDGSAFVAVGGFGLIMRSEDGENWSEITDPSITITMHGVVGVGNDWVAVGQGSQTAYSRDDGRTWHSVDIDYRYLWDVAWDGTRFVAVDNNSGDILHFTIDNPVWIPQQSNTTKKLKGIAGNGDFLVAVGEEGTILRSTNGEDNWSPQSSGPTDFLNSVAGDGTTFVAVGDGGIILNSTDSGLTWNERNSDTIDNLNGVAGEGTKFAAVGDNGTILLSTDSGETWSPQPIDFTEHLFDVAGAGTTWVAVGDTPESSYDDVILHTTDDWQTWGTETSRAPHLESVGWNGTAFLAVGWSGTISRSIDSGVTWHTVPYNNPGYPNENPSLKDVAGVGDIWVALDGTTAVLRSDDNGDSWQRERTESLANLLGVAGGGKNWVAVGGSSRQHSTDNGASWQSTEEVNIGNTLTSVAGDGNTFIAVGYYGTILRYAIGGTIAGTIWNEAGEPVAGVFVQVCRSSGCEDSTSNALGQYTFTGLDPDIYYVNVYPSSSTNLARGELGPISLGEHQTLVGQDLVLIELRVPPPGTSITPSYTPPNEIPVLNWTEHVTLTKEGCVEGLATYEIRQNGEVLRSGDMTEGPAGTYIAVILPLYPEHAYAAVYMQIACPDGSTEDASFSIYIDPSGHVRTVEGDPILGATVTLYRSDNIDGPFEQVPDGSAIMAPANRTNPDTTDAEGRFGWDVIAGYYFVRAEADGCVAPDNAEQPYVDSAILTIPPPVTDLDLRLRCPRPVTPTLSIATNNADIQLNWSTGLNHDHYEVHRSSLPFFSPDATTLQTTTSDTVYTDINATGEPATGYFYLVRVWNSDSTLSVDSNRVGKIDYALNNSGGQYTLIGVPFAAPTITNAATLAAHIGNVSSLLKWNTATQTYRFFIPPATGDNFAVNAGDAIYVTINNGGPSSVAFVGAVQPVQPAVVSGGYNFLTLPLQRAELTTAAAVAADIGSIGAMLSWNAETQAFRFYTPTGGGDNFAMVPGQPFIVQVEAGGPTSWPESTTTMRQLAQTANPIGHRGGQLAPHDRAIITPPTAQTIVENDVQSATLYLPLVIVK